MNWMDIGQVVLEFSALTLLGWVSNSIATWKYTRKVQRGSFPSKAAHLLYGIAKRWDKETEGDSAK